MVKLNVSDETLIKRDWLKSIALAVLTFCLAIAFRYGVQIEPTSVYDHRFHNASIWMLPSSVVFLFFVLYRLVIPIGAPVRLSPAGFMDLRVGRKIMPWNEIRNVSRKGQFVALTLNRKFAATYPLSITQRILKTFTKSAGPSHILIAEWCLMTDQTQLTSLLNEYREAHSR
jgi:hypothetical protein